MPQRKLLAPNAVAKCFAMSLRAAATRDKQRGRQHRLQSLSFYRYCAMLVLTLGTLGCHSWHMLRAMTPSDSDSLLVTEQQEPVGSDLATPEWSDDFSTPIRPARKPTPSTSSTTSTISTPSTTSRPSNLPSAPATQFTISDLEEHDPPVEDLPESGVALLTAELPDSPAFESGEAVTASHALAGATEPMMASDEIGEPMDFAAETIVTPTAPESSEDSGFFRNIFIDDAGTTGRSRAQGNAKAYSGIRRLFHHPDAKTRYRSHSRFSRQFQSQPRDE